MLKSTQRQLIETFATEVIPQARAGLFQPVLCRPPLIATTGILVSSRKTPALASAEHHPYSVNPLRWPALGLHACRYPSLALVMEGEVDLLVGVTRELAAEAGDRSLANMLYTLSLKPRNCLVMPPGVPYSDSSRAHWERTERETADSRVLWIRVLPTGVILQSCITRDGEHADTVAVLVQTAHCSGVAQVLLQSADGLPGTAEITASALLMLLLYIDQNWPLSRVVNDPGNAGLLEPLATGGITGPIERSPTVNVERVQNYIRANLLTHLTLPIIARNSYVSVPQLKRIFRSELNMTVMSFVAQCRIEEAKSMLQETDIAISDISMLCGYQHRTHFSRVFSREVGISPREFRSAQRAATSDVFLGPTRS